MTSISKAMTAARKDVQMHRMGRGYVVNVYNHQKGLWWTGNESTYDQAVQFRANAVARVALRHLRPDLNATDIELELDGATGPAAERVRHVLEALT